ncbi:MAG: flavodoxin-dependent (E)-4-hydroxy-3-methylbut-2-enyl-diphosphate synthase [Candidatus Bipolaricaulota bacterium]|nr:flavodoxin-dependent (E)-4-hydroxy-3-methylbut-2-enyl-diphosphate synthase [Candidatus Bipolaricaulota bacterium]MCX7844233.1 flavodoxin-dependent (E)-4-hydroxy-3-methylbut-2-enyl-diphosphate synthase [Candidatus Bipolaricaulota bacterium]MDW8152050.1 flavodoxin-dependent (E)-4-hydroxy-3-methylbut-2-enyl-diphosphate synthase [Candidatus Bipolaricaulota bacterium]
MRRLSRLVRVGAVPLGGGNPVAVQTMTTTDTRDVPATVAQIRAAVRAGAEIVRVAVPDRAAAQAIRAIKQEVAVPLVADIHYDHRLALAALAAGADKLRLNPGNLRDPAKIREVARAAQEKGVPIRVGVNAGSLDPRFLPRGREVTPEALVKAALWEIELLEREGFRDIVVSLKAHDVPLTVEANRLLAREGDWPIHVGITEPGPELEGIVRSAVGIGILLAEGIGDTIRVSLPGDPAREVAVAWEILRALGLRKRGPTFVVCPTCGRTGIDIPGIASEVKRRLAAVEKPITIAIMGCPVNGIGEAERADFAILGGQGFGTIYAHGKVLRPKVPEDRLVEEFLQVILAEVSPHG